MAEEPEFFFSFGNAKRREEFANRNIAFLKSLGTLKGLLEEVIRRATTTKPEDRIIYFSVRMVIEDHFNSVILLCANGYSDVAKQVLRSMFEWVVALLFMQKYPD